MFVLWRLLGLRRLLALLVLRKAWQIYRSRRSSSQPESQGQTP
jgi:hypothetical protein